MNPTLVMSRAYVSLMALLSWLPLVARADATNGPVVALGFTNTPIGETSLEVIEGGVLFVHDTSAGGGVSVELGEAGSGVFLFPLTGYLYGGETMIGRAYGRVNGVTNQFISSVQGIHNGNGTATVTVDFSAVGATRSSVFVDGYLIGQVTNSVVSVVVDGYGYDSQANPWSRLPDGSAGAVVQLATGGSFALPTDAPPPEPNAVLQGVTTTPGSGAGWGTRLFVRPDDPTNSVEHVARVEVTSTGLGSFCLTDARLEVFHLRHKALGTATLSPIGGLLAVGNLNSNLNDGVFVELPVVSSFNMEFLPIELPGTNTTLLFSGFGTSSNAHGTAVGTTRIDNRNGFVQISAELGIAPQTTEIEVRSNGVKVGSATVWSADAAVDLSGTPRLTGCTVLAKTMDTLPGFSVRVDRPTTFDVAWGGSFVGDEVRFLAPEPIFFESLESCVMVALELPSFTITNESTTVAPGPVLSLRRSAQGLTLSWPDPNHNHFIESTIDLADGFGGSAFELAFTNNHCQVMLNPTEVGPQFFRLRRLNRSDD